MIKHHKPLDKEEKEFMEFTENDQWKPNLSNKALQKEKRRLKKIAKKTLILAKKNKAVTFRISESDLDRFKVIAAKKGFRYQTLLTSIIHQYIVEHQ